MAETGIVQTGVKISIVWAVLLIVFGFLAIALPMASSVGIVILLAWLIVFSGGFQFIHAFQSKGAGNIIWKLLVAVLYLIVGIYFLMNPGIAVASFTLVLAIFFFAEGVLDLAVYFTARAAHGAGWILFDGIITIILGALIWAHWPSTAAWVIGTLVGISMIMTGTTRLMISLAAKSLIPKTA